MLCSSHVILCVSDVDIVHCYLEPIIATCVTHGCIALIISSRAYPSFYGVFEYVNGEAYRTNGEYMHTYMCEMRVQPGMPRVLMLIMCVTCV